MEGQKSIEIEKELGGERNKHQKTTKEGKAGSLC
jgi:hypothetical protein